MKNLRFICVQPANTYYSWHVETLIHNFTRMGINPNNIDIVCAIPEGQPTPPMWRKLADTYNTVRFFFYEDTRKNPCYISSVRPHILEKHFLAHPELTGEAIFYHDCDILFTRPPLPELEKFLDDDIHYYSDTRFYTSAEYIEGKGMGIYKKFCQIVDIDPAIPRKNELNSGGAQYIMKNITPEYWAKVYSDCEAMYKYMVEHLKIHPDEEAFYDFPKYHPIQIWCSDLYAVAFNSWKFGFEVKTPPELEFSWATQDENQWKKCLIFHNAGVVLSPEIEGKLFYKSHYTESLPYDLDPQKFSGDCSRHYVEELVETGKHTVLREFFST